MNYCYLIVDVDNAVTSRCEKGEFKDLCHEPQRLTGNYNFLLENGETYAGNLDAEYCPPKHLDTNDG